MLLTLFDEVESHGGHERDASINPANPLPESLVEKPDALVLAVLGFVLQPGGDVRETLECLREPIGIPAVILDNQIQSCLEI